MPQSNKKILSLDDLESKSKEIRAQGKQVVLCHGTFDLLHAGHIRHLQNARDEGAVLFTTVTADRFVNKGPGRPVFSEQIRAENLAALECVDFVSINPATTAVELINRIKPAIYAKGNDYQNASDDVTGNILKEINAVEAEGGQILYTNEITFSSTNLINEHFGVFDTGTREYLNEMKILYHDSDVIEKIQSLSDLNILVVGDAIVDEYHYTIPLGQSAKGSHLSVKYEVTEKFAGGAIAIANHLAGFSKNVTLVSALGKEDNHEKFIRSKLCNNVTAKFSYFPDAPTVVKRRFVDSDLNKLFEVYVYNEKPSLDEVEKEVCPWLENNTSKFDMGFVPDFGNGFISPNMIEILCDRAKFLSVNTQMNSGNRGFHAITRYPKADFISLNGPELRMATHNRSAPLETLIEQVAQKTQVKYFTATLGREGALLFDAKGKSFHKAPILSTKIIDRIGAGDSFLSLAGICLGGGLPAEIALFTGSAAAALDVQIVCNREFIAPQILFKYIQTLLK